VTATNDTGTGPASAASNSATPVAPTELYAWGINSGGQLGLGDQNISRSSPTQVGALTTWLTIDSWYHAIALQTNGTLWTWGSGDSGRLGVNSVAEASSPVQVGAGSWSFAAAGGQHSLGISSAGNLYAWGENGDGQLGQNNLTDRSSPVQIGSLTTWTSVTAGYAQSFGILSTGALYSWGGNDSGSLGHNVSSLSGNKSSPTQIGALTTWLQVDAGGEQNIAAIKTDGTLWTWGNNNYGQIGDNTTILKSSPVQVGALTNWAQVSEGYQTAMAVKTDGTLWGWGRNQSGQIGDNSRTQRSSPVQIGSLTTWLAVGSGNGTTIAVKTDGTLWTLGS
jgi:alpha-tubulin suppressor-like RCC1 family protein